MTSICTACRLFFLEDADTKQEIVATIQDRIFSDAPPDIRDQNFDENKVQESFADYPCATIIRVSTKRLHHLDGLLGLTESLVCVSAYAKTQFEADELVDWFADAGLTRVKGPVHGANIRGVQIQDSTTRDDYLITEAGRELRVFRSSVWFEIVHTSKQE